MSDITLRGNRIQTNGNLPGKGTPALDFKLVRTNMSDASLSDYKGLNIILNIFPSIDTSTCATSVRKFNQMAASLPNTKVICVSRDLPFAQKRFCSAEGIENVENLSDFKDGSFGKDYGLEMLDGSMAGLHARAIVVVDKNGMITHTELVHDLADEPDYDSALAVIK